MPPWKSITKEIGHWLPWDAKSFLHTMSHVGTGGNLVGKGDAQKKKAADASSNKCLAMTASYVLCMHVALFGAWIVQRSIFYKNILLIVLFFICLFYVFL